MESGKRLLQEGMVLMNVEYDSRGSNVNAQSVGFTQKFSLSTRNDKRLNRLGQYCGTKKFPAVMWHE